MSPIIDIYCHIFPDRFFQEMTKVTPMTREHRQAAAQRSPSCSISTRASGRWTSIGDYRQIISLPNPAIEDIATAGCRHEPCAHRQRRHGASCAENIPSAFPAFAAALCLTDVEGSVAEARRAIKDLGARGVLIYTNVAGRPLDEPEFDPIFAAMAELDAADLAASGRARRRCPTIRPRRNRASRCGGASAGPTTPRWR